MDSRRLDDRLAPALDEAELAQVWRRVRDAQADARRGAVRRRAFAFGGAGVAAALAAAIAVWSLWPAGASHRTAGPMTSAATALDPGVRVAAAVERALPMNDGSVVTLAPSSELEVLANEPDKFVTAVRRGRAHFDVRAGGPRRWVVETDLATVEVVGTTFSVARSTTELSVAVTHGVVLIRGERVPGRIIRLTAGDTLTIPYPAPPTSAAATRTGTETDTVAAAPIAARSAIDTSGAPRAADRSGSAAPIDRAARPPAPQAAIQSADRLLAAGKPADAAAILDAYLDDAPADGGAGLAAFLLGRIAQDSLHDPERAAAAFARTLQIGSPRAVQEEALARRARALEAAGRATDAAALAGDYLARFPSGAHAAAMRALAAPPSRAP